MARRVRCSAKRPKIRLAPRTGGFDRTPRIRVTPMSIPTPRPTPATHSSGIVAVPQTYLFDLDSGAVGSSGDIWFHAVSATKRYIEPRGGAQMAVGDRSNRANSPAARRRTMPPRADGSPMFQWVHTSACAPTKDTSANSA
jgi:hypothetical protein